MISVLPCVLLRESRCDLILSVVTDKWRSLFVRYYAANCRAVLQLRRGVSLFGIASATHLLCMLSGKQEQGEDAPG